MRRPTSACRRAARHDRSTTVGNRRANNDIGKIAEPEGTMFRIQLTALAVICGLAGSVAYAQDAASQKTVRFGWQAATPTSTFWIGVDQKTLEAQGLKLDLASFNDNAPDLEAVVARQVDMAVGAAGHA